MVLANARSASATSRPARKVSVGDIAAHALSSEAHSEARIGRGESGIIDNTPSCSRRGRTRDDAFLADSGLTCKPPSAAQPKLRLGVLRAGMIVRSRPCRYISP